MPVGVVLLCVAAFFVTAVAAVPASRWALGVPLIYGASLAVSCVALVAGVSHLAGGADTSSLVLPLGVPWLGSHFSLDHLAAFFLLIVNLGGATTSLFALGYGRHETVPMRVLPFYPAFLAAMNMVVLADDAFTFLFSWELMSLASWAIVISHQDVPGNVRAGYIYLVMAVFGTLSLLLAFGLLAGPAGGYAFDTIREAELGAWAAGLALIFTLIGAGSKAGLVPLHVWLPLAHPAAPSHVSALLSGVMTKVGVYGVVRIAFDLIDLPTSWAAVVILALGGITATLGVLYALMQHDLKRLLAYHTVENIGIIFIGLGLAMAFRANDMAWAAALAMTAALFHVFNHSVFKSLLFFGAGAVLVATGQRDLERMGGLIHRMPKTAIVFLIGCAAISALPPLNGFVSEWLTFQAILVSPQLPQWGLKLMIPAVGAMLALSAALAAACFVKAYGIAFLGRPRSPGAENAQEVDRFSLSAMAILAAICLLVGIVPGLVIDLLAPTVAGLVGARMPEQMFTHWLAIVPIAESRSSYSGFVILLFLAIAGTAIAMFVHRYATRATRRSAIWDCGYPDPNPLTQYSSSSFAMPIRRVFGGSVFYVREIIDMPQPGEMRAARYHVKVFDPAWRLVYGPIARSINLASLRFNRLQFLTIRRYLTLVFCALIILLLVVAVWR